MVHKVTKGTRVARDREVNLVTGVQMDHQVQKEIRVHLAMLVLMVKMDYQEH